MGLLPSVLFESPHPLTLSTLAFLILVVSLLGYVVYQRFLHPLAGYPGPFWASLTDLWQVNQFLSLKQPYHLTDLHQKYGEFVRYAPKKLSVTAWEAVPLVYQKGSRMMQKADFYDAFGSGHPNVFMMRDESAHSIRRRHMSSSFSTSSVKEMEVYIDLNVKLLKEKIAGFCDQGTSFDLSKLLHYFVIDVLGELAFGQSFGVQIADDESLVPPVKHHSLLTCAIASWPLMSMRLKKWLPSIPVPSLQHLLKGTITCAMLAARCVQRRLDVMQNIKDDGNAKQKQRKDLLTSLILARHPDTGEHLTQTDLRTEAFGFIVAGTHTTSATAALLFYHLLHAPKIMAKCVAEIDENLPPLSPDQLAYPVSIVEGSLPYLRQCIRENFRTTPVFTMPLERQVMAPEGITIAGRHIKQGTIVAVCNHAFHHNSDVWGREPNLFDPSRWDDPELAGRARYLMHFGLGKRQCLGKTVALANLYKLVTALLKEFEFELADPGEKAAADEGTSRGKLPDLISVGVSELEHPLMVRARRRGDQK